MAFFRPSSARDDAFFQLLAASARHAVTAAELLTQLLAAPPEERAGLLPRLKEVEHEADEATHAIIHKVNSSFVTPSTTATSSSSPVRSTTAPTSSSPWASTSCSTAWTA